VNDALTRLEVQLREIITVFGVSDPPVPASHVKFASVEELREKTLRLGDGVSSGERGAILALLGSIERAELLIRRIDAERKSINRAEVVARAEAAKAKIDYRPQVGGSLSPAPAE
jgi:phosphate:Na+ symporter